MQRATLLGPLSTIVGIAYFVDLFLRWGLPGGSDRLSATFSSWDIQLVIVSGEAVVALAAAAIVRLEAHGASFGRREGRVGPGT